MSLFRTGCMAIAFPLLLGLSCAVWAESDSVSSQSSLKETATSPYNGLELWANRCSSCHNARDPQEFSDKQWHVIIQHMRLRAGLSEEEAKAILEYLQASNAQ